MATALWAMRSVAMAARTLASRPLSLARRCGWLTMTFNCDGNKRDNIVNGNNVMAMSGGIFTEYNGRLSCMVDALAMMKWEWCGAASDENGIWLIHKVRIFV